VLKAADFQSLNEPACEMTLAVVGAYLSGMPWNDQLIEMAPDCNGLPLLHRAIVVMLYREANLRNPVLSASSTVTAQQIEKTLRSDLVGNHGTRDDLV
jgi:hypothetical protein